MVTTASSPMITRCGVAHIRRLRIRQTDRTAARRMVRASDMHPACHVAKQQSSERQVSGEDAAVRQRTNSRATDDVPKTFVGSETFAVRSSLLECSCHLSSHSRVLSHKRCPANIGIRCKPRGVLRHKLRFGFILNEESEISRIGNL